MFAAFAVLGSKNSGYNGLLYSYIYMYGLITNNKLITKGLRERGFRGFTVGVYVDVNAL